MPVFFEIWRDDSPNLSASFATRREALAALRTTLDAGQAEVVRASALVRAEPNGYRRVVAEGDGLIELARRSPVDPGCTKEYGAGGRR